MNNIINLVFVQNVLGLKYDLVHLREMSGTSDSILVEITISFFLENLIALKK